MWALFLKLLPVVLGWFGIGQTDPTGDANKAGVVSGKAQEDAVYAHGALKELDTANRARDAAADTIRTDGVRAPDSDMTKRGADGVS